MGADLASKFEEIGRALTVPEVAKLLGFSRSALYEMTNECRLLRRRGACNLRPTHSHQDDPSEDDAYTLHPTRPAWFFCLFHGASDCRALTFGYLENKHENFPAKTPMRLYYLLCKPQTLRSFCTPAKKPPTP